MIMDQRALNRAISEKMSRLTDEEVFTSEAYKHRLTQMSTGVLSANRGKTVTILGDPNVTAYTDGTTRTINARFRYVTEQPDRAAKDKFMRGFNLHETAHCLLTDFALHKRFIEKLMKERKFLCEPYENPYKAETLKGIEAGVNVVEIFHRLDNTLEDAFINKAVQTAAPGYYEDLLFVLDQLSVVEKFDYKEEAGKLPNSLMFANIALLYAVYGIKVYKAAEVLGTPLLILFEEAIPWIDKAIVEADPEKRKRFVSTVFCYLFHAIKMDWQKKKEEKKKEQQEKDGQKQQQGQKGSDGESSDKSQKSEGKSEDEGGEGASGDEQDDSEEQSGQSDGSNGSSSTEGENENSEDEEGSSEGSSEQEESEGSGSTGVPEDPDEQEGEGSGSSSTAVPDDPDEQEGEGSGSGETREEEKDEEDGEGEGTEGSEADDDETDGSSSADEAGETEEDGTSPEEEPSAEELQDLADQLQNEMKSSEQADHSMAENKKADKSAINALRSAQEKPDQVSQDAPAQDSMEKFEKDLAEKEVEEEQEEELKNQLNKDTKAVSSTDMHRGVHCQVIRPEKTSASEALYERERGNLDTVVRRMSREFLKEIKERQTGDTMTGLYNGKSLDVNHLYRDDKRIFAQKILPEDIPDMAVGILVDCSGSMSWGKRNGEDYVSRMDYARKCAYVTYAFCKQLKIPCFVIGHTTDGYSVVLLSVADENSLDKDESRRIFSLEAQSSNRDGYALRYCLNKLEKIQAKDRLMLVISDGQPAAYNYGMEEGKADLQDAVHDAIKKGIFTVAAGIDDDAEKVKYVYKDGRSDKDSATFLSITDLDRLPKAFVKIIKKRLS